VFYVGGHHLYGHLGERPEDSVGWFTIVHSRQHQLSGLAKPDRMEEHRAAIDEALGLLCSGIPTTTLLLTQRTASISGKWRESWEEYGE
jgi:orotate phosphoribosyltransferase-like protein